jgi:hypothetical protein
MSNLTASSLNPECDLARVLKARGYTGKATLLDGKTKGLHRQGDLA